MNWRYQFESIETLKQADVCFWREKIVARKNDWLLVASSVLYRLIYLILWKMSYFSAEILVRYCSANRDWYRICSYEYRKLCPDL